MTTAQLLSKVYSLPILKDARLSLGDPDIYLAATLTQTDILTETSILEESNVLTFVANQEVYDSGDATWLPKVWRFKDPIRYTDTTKGILVARSKRWVDEQRAKVVDGGGSAEVPKFYYPLRTSPLSLGFWPVPETALEVTATYVRQHSATDDISDSVDPLVPDAYLAVFLRGIEYYLLDYAGADFAQAAANARTKYDNELIRAKLKAGMVDTSFNPPSGDVFVH